MTTLESTIGYEFRDYSLFRHAMTHSSYINEHALQKTDCNERLEFLGDSILEMVSSEFLYHHYPHLMEGDMSKIRSTLVCERALAASAREINLQNELILGNGMEKTNARENDSVISDAFEALIAAIFLDSGLAPAKRLIYDHVLNNLSEKLEYYDSKTILQERLQKEQRTFRYVLLSEEGPDHNRSFTSCVEIEGKPFGTGTAHSKKQAEQEAAFATLQLLKEAAQKN